jgi:hypothetical protein
MCKHVATFMHLFEALQVYVNSCFIKLLYKPQYMLGMSIVCGVHANTDLCNSVREVNDHLTEDSSSF